MAGKGSNSDAKRRRNTKLVEKLLDLEHPVVNDKMIDFLKENGVCNLFMSYLTRPNGAPGATDPLRVREHSNQVAMKRSYKAMELLTQPSKPFAAFMSEHIIDFADMLFAVAEPTSDGNWWHFNRAFEYFLKVNTDEMLAYVLANRILFKLIPYLHEPAVVDSVLTVLTCRPSNDDRHGIFQRLVDEEYLTTVLAVLWTPGTPAQAAEAAGEFLVQFMDQMCSEDSADLLFDQLVADDSTFVARALRVICNQAGDAEDGSSSSSGGGGGGSGADGEDGETNTAAGAAEGAAANTADNTGDHTGGDTTAADTTTHTTTADTTTTTTTTADTTTTTTTTTHTNDTGDSAMQADGGFNSAQQGQMAEVLVQLMLKSEQQLVPSVQMYDYGDEDEMGSLPNMLQGLSPKLHEQLGPHCAALCALLLRSEQETPATKPVARGWPRPEPTAAEVPFPTYKVKGFGTFRLAVLEILCEVSRVMGDEILDTFPTAFWPALVNWFFDYPQNNLFHSLVYRLFDVVVKTNHVQSLRGMFSSGKFLTRMVETYEADKTTGCRGHILLFCNMVRLAADTQEGTDYLHNLLVSHGKWKSFSPRLRHDTFVQIKKRHGIDDGAGGDLRMEGEDDGIDLGSCYAKQLGFEQAPPKRKKKNKRKKKRKGKYRSS